MSRFYYHPVLQEKTSISLSQEESHHLKANRVERGDEIHLTDGSGNLYSGIVKEFVSQLACIEVRNIIRTYQNRYQLWVWQPFLKNLSRLDWVIEKLTEIGVTGIGIFPSHRCVRDGCPPSRIKRWEKIIIEACKQSGRLPFPSLKVVGSWDQFLSFCQQSPREVVVGDLLTSSKLWNFLIQKSPSFELQLVVGPEGDFSYDEKKQLQSLPQVHFLNFGDHILRSETASLYGAAICIAGMESKYEGCH